MRLVHTSIAITLVAATVACAPAGPDYLRPTLAPPTQHRTAQITTDQARSLADTAWADLFRSPELAALVRDALDHNLDLMAAAARVEEFRGRAALAGIDTRPTVAGAFKTAPSPTGGAIDNAYNAGIFFNWEIDFFGRLRRSAEAARADLLASESGQRAVMASIVTGVADLYVTLRALDEQAAILKRNIQVQEDTLALARRLSEGGVASGLEVQQALTQVASTRAALPRVERQILQVENALSFLAGRAPGPVARGAGDLGLPVVPEVPAGLPSALLERRPDIVAAEHQLRAANARIGVAVANRIPVPRIGLTASFGRLSTSLSDFFSGGVKAQNLLSWGPFVDLPIYDGSRANSRIRIAHAQAEQAALAYRSAFLQALREVADALGTGETAVRELAETQASLNAAREYYRLTDMRYRGGVASYLEVLDAQRQVLSTELAVATSRTTQLSATVALYRALGGGWSDEELARLSAREMTARK